MQQYASDNYAGICPEAFAAMHAANEGSAGGYGDDVWTARAEEAFRSLFETECAVFFVFNGTAANALALAAMCQPYHAVICAERAHIDVDEAGAPQFFTGGARLLVAAGADGKLTPEDIRRAARARGDVHFSRPRAVSISQSTENGQVYAAEQVASIGAACRELGLRLHMDGARFANAVASLGCAPADVTWRAGVEVLCFGGTKNGMAMGEAVVFFDRALAEEFAWRRKQSGQLASKMRFLSAPWVAMLGSDGWRRNAAHGNACARRFADAARRLDPRLVLYPAEANAVFLDLPVAIADGLRARGWVFYTFAGNASRFMFGWDADTARLDALIGDLSSLVGACLTSP
jgi:threonine aldolase